MKVPLLLIAPVLAIAAVTAACGGDDYGDDSTSVLTAAAGSTPVAGLIAIEVADNTFTPSSLSVPKGTKVTWDWAGKNAHSVAGAWQGGAVQSERFSRDGSFEFTFAAEGTFDYQCGVHGAAMAGKVTVKP